MAPPPWKVTQASTEAFDEWLTLVAAGSHVSKLQHNTAVVQFAGMLELCLDPVGVLVRPSGDSSGPMTPQFPVLSADNPGLGLTSPTPLIGRRGSVESLRLFKAMTGDATFSEQKRYVGAMAWQLQQLQRATIEVTPRRGAALMLAIPAGYYVIAGIASLAVVAAAAVVSWIQETEQTKRSAVVLAGAGQDYAARLASYRASGTMPAPSARETAAAAAVDTAANSFWAQLGSGLGEGVKTGTKWVMGAAALGIVLLAFNNKGARDG